MKHFMQWMLLFNLIIGGTLAMAQPDGPRRGLSQADVRQQYGEPASIKGPIGEPPITRWDYNGFSVYFEYQTVLHTVHTSTHQG